MRLFVSFALILVIGASSLRGESYGASVAHNPSGTFRGVIVDVNGKRIRGASVTVQGVNLNREVKPNREGYFEIDLPVGVYEVSVKKRGFAMYKLTNLEVKGGDEQSHVFRLKSSRVQSAVRSLRGVPSATHNKALQLTAR